MEKERYYLEFKQGEIQFHLWRLAEEEYRQFRDHSLPLKEDRMFMIQLMLSERYNPDRLSLPKVFLTLEHLFGKTSDWFDKWKCSFSFPLLLVLKKSAGQFYYLLRVEDYRGSLEFRLYRFLENGVDGYDVNIYREPFELEFSREEINQFICYLYGYLIGAAKVICVLPLRPFLKCIDSNHILYGYRDGKLFEEQIDSEEDYEAAIRTFEKNYETPLTEERVKDLRSLLHKVTGESLK